MKSFLQGALPSTIASKLNYASLQADPNNYVDQQLQDFYADVVYTCGYGAATKLQLAFLFEHKSYVPQRPHLQLLRYMLNMWEQRLKEGLSLYPIIPMIVYHGQETWKIKELKDYFEGDPREELSRFIPSFDYLLVNLHLESHTSIRSRFGLLTLQMGFLLMKWVRDDRLLDWMEEILEGIETIQSTEQGRIFLEQFFVYLLGVTKINPEKVMEKARYIWYEAGEFVDTAGAKLIRQGIEQGIEQGIKQTLYQHISKMLLNKMEVRLIAKILDVPEKQVKEIQSTLRKEGKLK